MQEFVTQNKALVWLFLVVLVTAILIFSVVYFLRFFEKKWKRAANFTVVFKSLRRITRIFFIALGALLVSYIFFERNTYELINQNILRVIWFGIVISSTIIFSAISQSYFTNKMERLSRRDQGDITLYKYLNYLASAMIYLSGIVLIAVAIPALRNFAAAAGASAGVFALIAGVASQEGIANLVGGLFIAFFKPFRIGDVVKIGPEIMGKVEDINLRHTVINNFQNKRIVIPNAIINKENITNYYMGEFKICEWLEVDISYSSDIDLAIATLQKVCEAHPYCLDNRTKLEKDNNRPVVEVQVVSLGNSGIKLKAWVWAASYLTGFKMRNQLYKTIKEQFDATGIEIPFPHSVVVLKSDTAHVEPASY